jgi:hypothetical protein
MKKKNLIIGAIQNYNWDQIKIWIKSINQNVKNCDKIMLCYNISKETMLQLNHNGFKIYESNLNKQIVVQRFYDIWNILRVLDLSEYDNIITTDVKDVVFNSDPFVWIEDNAKGYKIIASSENLNYKNENWGINNLKMCYGEKVKQSIQDKCIYNAGVIAGEVETIKNLFLLIYLISNAAESYNPDQAAYNILLHSDLFKDKIYFPNEEKAWAAQLGTNLDSNKSYSEYHLETPPKIINDKILNSLNMEYCITHQYDRNADIKNIIYKKYE